MAKSRKRGDGGDAGELLGGATAQLPATDREDEGGELQDLMQQFGPSGGYRVHIDRREPRNDAGYCGTIDLTADFLDVVKARFGGGVYSGRITGDAGYLKRVTFRIAGAPRIEREPAPGAGATTATPETTLADALKVISDNNRAAFEALRDGLKELAGARGGVNSLDDFQKVATILSTVGGGGRGGDTLAIVDRVLSLRDKILEGGSGASESELATIVRDGVKPLIELGTAYVRRLPAPSPAAVATSSDPVAAIAQRIPPFAKKFLLSKAAAGANPSLYAEMALDQLSGEDHDALRPLLAAQDFSARFVAAVPEFAPHAAWFAEWAVSMRDLLAAATPAPTTGGSNAVAGTIDGGKKKAAAGS